MKFRIVHAKEPFFYALKTWIYNCAVHIARVTLFHLGIVPPRSPVVFCIGIQRSGTTSFGDFCESTLGLKRRGFEVSSINGWTRAWMDGEVERIFSSADFRTGEVFEDDPWWCPEFYEALESRFPDSKFVLITRNVDDWFKSLVSHSGGRSPGETEIHAKIYGRQEDFETLKESRKNQGKIHWQGLELSGHDIQYKQVYREHTANVLNFFSAHAQERFLHIELEDPEKFRKLAVFLGFPDTAYDDVHSNRSVDARH